MKLFENLIVALSMYSKIPMPQIEWNKDNMRFALCFFPAVGAAVGVLIWLWGRISAFLPVGNTFVTAVFLLIPVLITGGIHLDGLLDTADALSSWQPMERRLEILKDSHAGAFAIIVCCSYFVAAFGIWSEVDRAAISVLAGGYVLSRALSGFAIATFPCAKKSGLAATFADQADRKKCRIILLLEIIASAAFMVSMDLICGVFAVAAALIVFFVCKRLFLSKFGGITGDTQGCFLQFCELFMALAVIIGEKLFPVMGSSTVLFL